MVGQLMWATDPLTGAEGLLWTGSTSAGGLTDDPTCCCGEGCECDELPTTLYARVTDCDGDKCFTMTQDVAGPTDYEWTTGLVTLYCNDVTDVLNPVCEPFGTQVEIRFKCTGAAEDTTWFITVICDGEETEDNVVVNCDPVSSCGNFGSGINCNPTGVCADGYTICISETPC